MSDKCPHRGMSTKSGRSIKEERAERHAKAAGATATVESLGSRKK